MKKAKAKSKTTGTKKPLVAKKGNTKGKVSNKPKGGVEKALYKAKF